MRAAFIIATTAVLAGTASAAPLEKRGGYWDSNGEWVDDGYWQWSHGDRSEPFVPWANGVPESAPQGIQEEHSSGNDGSFAFAGEATYFFQHGNPGACGQWHSDSDYVVALDQRMYNDGAHCDEYVVIQNQENGRSVTAKVADMCPTCSSSNALDLSAATYDAIGAREQGVLPIQWNWA